MRQIIITESQLRFLTEALGVPDSILESSEDIFNMVAEDIKTINSKKDKYTFENDVDIVIGDKKKINIDKIILTVTVEHFDGFEGKPEIVSMAMGQTFHFDRKVMMKRIEKSTVAEMDITFGVGDEWEPTDLYESLMKEKDEHMSSIAHEIKHKYDKQSKEIDLVGRDAEYAATQRYGHFGVPAIDNVFMRYMYYIHMTESLVRAVEVASQIRSKNITKSQFRDFLENNRVYKELLDIRNYSFRQLLTDLKSQMNNINKLLDHVDIDYTNMSEREKIIKFLEIVYVTLVNKKLDLFMDMTRNKSEEFRSLFSSLFGSSLGGEEEKIEDQKVDKVRQKFYNFIIKYRDRPVDFFKDEIENYSYNANKMIKKLSKLYDMAKDDENVNESIINWELHQKLMEKKYGKRPIQTKINPLR
jgi:hypothetical protein